jgi:hypothetical protein
LTLAEQQTGPVCGSPDGDAVVGDMVRVVTAHWFCELTCHLCELPWQSDKLALFVGHLTETLSAEMVRVVTALWMNDLANLLKKKDTSRPEVKNHTIMTFIMTQLVKHAPPSCKKKNHNKYVAPSTPGNHRIHC